MLLCKYFAVKFWSSLKGIKRTCLDVEIEIHMQGSSLQKKMHGFGVYNFSNGDRYEGAWHEGKKQGLGMYTFRNSETQSRH